MKAKEVFTWEVNLPTGKANLIKFIIYCIEGLKDIDTEAIVENEKITIANRHMNYLCSMTLGLMALINRLRDRAKEEERVNRN